MRAQGSSHPDEWPIVARILGERSRPRSCQAIADDLNAEGIPTPTGTRGLVRGPAKWSAATVAKLCRNPHVLAAASE